MTDHLSALVPPHEPAKDALAAAAKAALSAVPVVGPFAAEALAHALEVRQSERQHRFNAEVAQALTSVMGRLDTTLSLEDVLSDEFLAAWPGRIELRRRPRVS